MKNSGTPVTAYAFLKELGDFSYKFSALDASGISFFLVSAINGTTFGSPGINIPITSSCLTGRPVVWR